MDNQAKVPKELQAVKETHVNQEPQVNQKPHEDKASQAIIDIESKLAFLEMNNDSLSDSLIHMQGQLDALARRVEMLTVQLAEVDRSGSDSASGTTITQHEVPPHY